LKNGETLTAVDDQGSILRRGCQRTHERWPSTAPVPGVREPGLAGDATGHQRPVAATDM